MRNVFILTLIYALSSTPVWAQTSTGQADSGNSNMITGKDLVPKVPDKKEIPNGGNPTHAPKSSGFTSPTTSQNTPSAGTGMKSTEKETVTSGGVTTNKQ